MVHLFFEEELGQDRADGHGEPSVLIRSAADFIKTLPAPPDWLTEIQDEGRRRDWQENAIRRT